MKPFKYFAWATFTALTFATVSAQDLAARRAALQLLAAEGRRARSTP